MSRCAPPGRCTSLADEDPPQRERPPARGPRTGSRTRAARATLGLDDDAARLGTARLTVSLLEPAGGTADATETVRVLAAAELPRENAIYQAHLDSAEVLTAALRDVNWQVLDDLARRLR